ncbi:MAG: NupC/NupG family nucleoside CNT transporter [Candidatus Hydrogenedentes bacterium]|nr:NupC/NupG family nucleoside CNT transporter [Candidatus Hydrogenedentota bacterium]
MADDLDSFRGCRKEKSKVEGLALRLVSLLGLFVMIGIAWGLSENRWKVDWRLVAWGAGLQLLIGVFFFWTPFGEACFTGVRVFVDVLTNSANEGASFLFGVLTTDPTYRALIAFQVLPVIIFVSAVAGVLYHLRVIQAAVHALAFLMRRTLRTSGAETFGAALLVFTGIESMTALAGYLKNMTRSELCTVMTTFMATIAGSVMVAYSSPQIGANPGHLLAASLMSAPAGVLIAKLLVPETGEPETRGAVRIEVPVESHNVVDAAARGTTQGLTLALNVGAMLIAFIGIVYMLNLAFEAVTRHSFTNVMGWFFRPFAFLMGVPAHDLAPVGRLLGMKTVLNEFLAYIEMKNMVDGQTLTPRSVTIATYALCGFANPGSLGILIAGISAFIPERRVEIVSLGLKSFVGGTLACFMTACVAGVLVYE